MFFNYLIMICCCLSFLFAIIASYWVLAIWILNCFMWVLIATKEETHNKKLISFIDKNITT